MASMRHIISAQLGSAIVNNMERSYAPRFLAATGPTMIYNGSHLDDASNNAVNNLVYTGSALEEFIKEMQ